MLVKNSLGMEKGSIYYLIVPPFLILWVLISKKQIYLWVGHRMVQITG